MPPDISPENEQYLENAVATGVFHDRSEALNTAIALLKQRDQLIADVNHGIEQLDRGLGRPFDLDAIMRAVEKRIGETEERDA